jgi:hypothetical protein
MARATTEQLGWDDTVRRVLVPGNDEKSEEIQYQMKVGQDNWYQTVRQLADFRANDIVGRATRVWEVVKLVQVERRPTRGRPVDRVVEDPQKTYVLKDFWMDCLGDEEQEAITIKRVRHTLRMWMDAYPDAPSVEDFEEEDATGATRPEFSIDPSWLEPPVEGAYAADAEPHFKDEEWGSRPYDRYFPHVLAHGFVKLSSGRVDRASKILPRDVFDRLLGNKGTHPPPHVPTPLPKTSVTTNEASIRKRSRGGVSKPAESTARKHMLQSARFRDAVHYREIVEHVGTPLEDVGTLNELVRGLKDASIGTFSYSCFLTASSHAYAALRWFFRAGRIHRDLSLGNLILVNVVNKDTKAIEPVVQLHDWEYSRSFVSDEPRATHGFKTVSGADS